METVWKKEEKGTGRGRARRTTRALLRSPVGCSFSTNSLTRVESVANVRAEESGEGGGSPSGRRLRGSFVKGKSEEGLRKAGALARCTPAAVDNGFPLAWAGAWLASVL